jgi:20S proteasome alpha/beta subunit
MTTVAYRNGVLAADTRVMSSGWKTPIRVTKLYRIGNEQGYVAATIGRRSATTMLVQWLQAGAPAGFMPDLDDESKVIVLVSHDRLRVFEAMGCFEIDAEFIAFGSGMSVANAALIMGADAKRAVEVAAMLDESTGPDVETMSMEPA